MRILSFSLVFSLMIAPAMAGSWGGKSLHDPPIPIFIFIMMTAMMPVLPVCRLHFRTLQSPEPIVSAETRFQCKLLKAATPTLIIFGVAAAIGPPMATHARPRPAPKR